MQQIYAASGIVKGASLYVGEAADGIERSGAVYRYDGTTLTTITDGINNPQQITVDRSGNLYVANYSAGTVTVYPRGATAPSRTIAVCASQPCTPEGVTVNFRGQIYVTSGPNNIDVFNTSTNGSVGHGTVPTPLGIAFDKRGSQLFVASGDNELYEIIGPISQPSAISYYLENDIFTTSIQFDENNYPLVASGGGDVGDYLSGVYLYAPLYLPDTFRPIEVFDQNSGFLTPYFIAVTGRDFVVAPHPDQSTILFFEGKSRAAATVTMPGRRFISAAFDVP